MAASLQRVEYYYVVVEDKRGEGYWILEHLFQKGVNLISFTAFPLGSGKTQLDFIADDPEKFRAAAAEAHINLVGPKRAFLLTGEDKPGGVVEIHRRLSNAGINVHAANAIATGDGKFGLILWVKHEIYEEAARALGV
jgi:hypothetical protein